MALFKKPATEDRKALILGRIEGDHISYGSGAGAFFLVAGLVVMVIAILVEGSAVRLAAWGAIWTGWNVLCAIPIIIGQVSVRYVIYRENPPAA